MTPETITLRPETVEAWQVTREAVEAGAWPDWVKAASSIAEDRWARVDFDDHWKRIDWSNYLLRHENGRIEVWTERELAERRDRA